ncbi:MAG: DUF4345 domain-containing protein [Parasphingorhabdus sp.]|uniref:DUF4345 domain-containing protein n=1 Tax=Parasphingorhabdus sp. TaxID=2709688 RepID=UPI0032983008
MMASLFTSIFIGVAGGLLIMVGTGLLFQPHEFSAAHGIILADNPSQLSEVRAPGAFLMISALFLLFSVGRTRFLQPAVALIIAIYGSYGFARLFSLMHDGLPSQALVQAMALELAVAFLGAILWLRLRFTQSQ